MYYPRKPSTIKASLLYVLPKNTQHDKGKRVCTTRTHILSKHREVEQVGTDCNVGCTEGITREVRLLGQDVFQGLQAHRGLGLAVLLKKQAGGLRT